MQRAGKSFLALCTFYALQQYIRRLYVIGNPLETIVV